MCILFIVFILCFVGFIFRIPKLELFQEWEKHARDDRNEALLRYISTKQDLGYVNKESMKNIKKRIQSFSARIRMKIKKAHYTKSRFLLSNKEYLKTDVNFYVSNTYTPNAQWHQSGNIQTNIKKKKSELTEDDERNELLPRIEYYYSC